jgi:predicted PhzF superfamily epimerase YddE/YHI9
VPATELTLLRVFAGEDGRGGNPLAVFLDGAAVPPERRQTVAAEIGLSETVFVDDSATGELRIFTPAVELPLAGHPLVGTAWLLAETGAPVETLRPPAGEVPTWREDEITWIQVRPEVGPEFELRRLASPDEVDAQPVPAAGDALLAAWAWLDEPAREVRARVFPRGIGIDEDEATGSAALRLVAALGRPITIRQGRGSVLLARPGEGGYAAVGGRCALVDRVDSPYE